MPKKLYQTVENRDNADEVEQQGPYRCDSKLAWLGPGYYFWDSDIKLGHWWGKKHYPNSSYIICRSTIPNDNEVFDLYNRFDDRKVFSDCAEIIRKECRANDVKVQGVIEYLKCHTSFQKRYKGIRAYGNGSASYYDFASYRFKFVDNNKAFLDNCPAIQYCIIDKTLLTGYEIVYPDFIVRSDM